MYQTSERHTSPFFRIVLIFLEDEDEKSEPSNPGSDHSTTGHDDEVKIVGTALSCFEPGSSLCFPGFNTAGRSATGSRKAVMYPCKLVKSQSRFPVGVRVRDSSDPG